MRIDLGAGREGLDGMFFGAAAIAQGIEYHRREMYGRAQRGELGTAVTLTRFGIAMARGERAIVAPVPIAVASDDEQPSSFDYAIMHVTTLEPLVPGLSPCWGEEAAPPHYASVRAGAATGSRRCRVSFTADRTLTSRRRTGMTAATRKGSCSEPRAACTSTARCSRRQRGRRLRWSTAARQASSSSDE